MLKHYLFSKLGATWMVGLGSHGEIKAWAVEARDSVDLQTVISTLYGIGPGLIGPSQLALGHQKPIISLILK